MGRSSCINTVELLLNPLFDRRPILQAFWLQVNILPCLPTYHPRALTFLYTLRIVWHHPRQEFCPMPYKLPPRNSLSVHWNGPHPAREPLHEMESRFLEWIMQCLPEILGLPISRGLRKAIREQKVAVVILWDRILHFQIFMSHRSSTQQRLPSVAQRWQTSYNDLLLQANQIRSLCLKILSTLSSGWDFRLRHLQTQKRSKWQCRGSRSPSLWSHSVQSKLVSPFFLTTHGPWYLLGYLLFWVAMNES